ncbi:Histidinol dehydrogenase [Pseudovibrio sp. Ad13]|uniref:histidinol dehydrogenase n=1 Tax=unclassified Pseudovibrio TaxID=2627060 RepID=UPI0007AE6BCF|nr:MULTISPECIES: histidinol dehydrogenase [unclassified Pseudovibrio]KZK85370.1 Histidinol dehydrogenase [Pseudovibrio sp. Ad13]KZL19782.1 Histidinol dehydrogenase [Pseudovibrio sp. WM33]KZL26939.1 Histidinol dehydrogenase [Pseudovibrio sp. Ad37]
MAIKLSSKSEGFEEEIRALLGSKRETSEDVDHIVRDILRDVEMRGDAAVLEYTNKFDRMSAKSMDELKVTEAEIEAAVAQIPAETLEALQLAHDRIRSHHQKQLPESYTYKDAIGVELGAIWTAVEAVGVYVPGGLASYPSSVLMNVVPAKVAGVERIVMVVPSPDDVLNPLVLAAAKMSGVSEIYRVGGAQAVGALAYGTETIAPVSKIVGPGNAYVSAAKRRVFGTVGIDMIAGPSEILVVADKDNNPDWVAVDLLSQAEHDPVAQSILITDSEELAAAVEEAVERQLTTLPRADVARQSWNDFGAIITVDNLDDAMVLSNRFAPEHLELCVEDPDALLPKMRNAGAVFVGRYTPEAIGDYVGGSNHVLPTARSARFSSGLSTLEFVKRTSLLRCNPENLAQIGPAAVTLAEVEGLQAHGRSVSIRLNH